MPDSRAHHLDWLEDESIEILRETCATATNPVLMYSIGKDSSVLLHLALKAFAPAPLPLPLLHIDTTWKFQDMYRHRQRVVERSKARLIVHTNQDGLASGITPFTHGSSYYTDVMKTQALKQALDAHAFDVVIGGARRDEERSRAKERIVSVRTPGHRWNPKRQRPELWNLFNTRLQPGETLRVFPLSNWTELDVWQYIARERIEIVPLYFAAPRRVVRRHGTWIMLDDDRMPLAAGESAETRVVRFRTLGCYPLSGAIESHAAGIDDIIRETTEARSSERQGRLIDGDQPASMEIKKQDGYF
jgi:sulfate adenylyltransferase subunit 2